MTIQVASRAVDTESRPTVDVVFAAAKREANELIRARPRRAGEGELIRFFCECADSECLEGIWLTRSEYERARAAPAWRALVPSHRGRSPKASRDDSTATRCRRRRIGGCGRTVQPLG